MVADRCQCGPPYKSMSEADQCQVIESWCAANARVRRTQINHHCRSYCEVGGLNDSLDTVRSKFKICSFREGQPTFENCAPLAIVKSGCSWNAVGVGARDVFQCLSTCYFGTPKVSGFIEGGCHIISRRVWRRRCNSNGGRPVEDETKPNNLSSQPPPSETIITKTTNCHFHHNHHLSLSSLNFKIFIKIHSYNIWHHQSWTVRLSISNSW